MQKIGRASAQVAGRFLFLGVSVQILLGICWGVRSFGIFPEFGDSYTWLKASETLVCDDYMGIGYPLFLMLVKGIESISSIPYMVEYLGHVLPAAIFGMLIVYCLKGVSLTSGSHGIPEAIAIGVTVALHKWRHQTLVSIAGGTLCYVLLVQMVF